MVKGLEGLVRTALEGARAARSAADVQLLERVARALERGGPESPQEALRALAPRVREAIAPATSASGTPSEGARAASGASRAQPAAGRETGPGTEHERRAGVPAASRAPVNVTGTTQPPAPARTRQPRRRGGRRSHLRRPGRRSHPSRRGRAGHSSPRHPARTAESACRPSPGTSRHRPAPAPGRPRLPDRLPAAAPRESIDRRAHQLAAGRHGHRGPCSSNRRRRNARRAGRRVRLRRSPGRRWPAPSPRRRDGGRWPSPSGAAGSACRRGWWRR